MSGSSLKAKQCVSVVTCVLDTVGSFAASNEIILGLFTFWLLS